MKQSAVAFAAQSIRTHLQSSPFGMDTVEGVHACWIDWTEPVPPMLVTQQALEHLEANGTVERVMVDTRSLWRRKA